MPLAELHTYRGSSPAPARFDDYWNAALAEMCASDSQVVLTGVDHSMPRMDCFELSFAGVGGARLSAKYIRPHDDVRTGSAVLLFHGYGDSSGDWFDLLPYASFGHCVAALDCRGQGGRSHDVGGHDGYTLEGQFIRGLDPSSPEKLLYRQIYLDCVQLANIVMSFPEVDPDRIGVAGASQGGALATVCAALEPRVRRASITYPFLSDFKRVWELGALEESAYRELRTYFRLFDPQHLRGESIFETLGFIDVQNFAPRVRAETLFTVALQDLACPPSTQFAVFNKIESPKSLLAYPEFGHERLRGHSDAVFTFLSQL